jgi:SpoIID/LytB domain protein
MCAAPGADAIGHRPPFPMTPVRHTQVRRLAVLLASLAALLVLPAAAPAASKFQIDGRGWGHGIGMSQYGAYGYAQHGWGYRQILGHYYSGTDLSKVSGRTVRVLLQSAPSTIRFTNAVAAGDRRLQPGTTYAAVRKGAKVELRSPAGRKLESFTTVMRVTGSGGTLKVLGAQAGGVANGRYRGAMEFRVGSFSGISAINAVALESYIRGVVPSEMPAGWASEALKTQAVAARTYAITTGKNGAGFDQYATTASQVYRGMAAEQPTTDAAIAATTGQVVTYNGSPVVTYFFSTSGGRTENVEFSFLGAQANPWLRSVQDEYDAISPRHTWRFKWSKKTAAWKLRAYTRGTFRGIKVTRRGESPRIVSAEVLGSRGRVTVSGPTLRRVLGLYDTWAKFTLVTTTASKPEPDTSGGEGTTASDGGAVAAGMRGRSAATRAEIAGRLYPAPDHSPLVVELRTGKRWVAVGSVRLGDGGSYRVAVTRKGTYRVHAGRITGPAVTVR